ncbi:MAG: hypothetical protein JXQ29_08195 [Planctomycetes bacterium]|nr:hypothetical protein [Planctomycetota bacterium]
MVFENDPFENFKRQRQVELIEQGFKNKAETRRKELDDLVRSGQRSSELADRIHEEMQEFFNESKEQVSRLFNESKHPDSVAAEKGVQEEMEAFFRESTATAERLLAGMCDAAGDPHEATDRMVDHLKDVFQRSMDRIARVREQYAQSEETAAKVAGVANLTDVVQTINELADGEDPFRRQTPPAAPVRPGTAAGAASSVVTATPEDDRLGAALPHRRVERDSDEDTSSQRILRRHGHLPSGKARKVGMSLQEIGELRALKELLIQKGIISREEIAEQQAAAIRGAQAD